MLEGRPGQPDDALCHSSTITSMVLGTDVCHPREAVRDIGLHPGADFAGVRAPGENEVHLDGHLALVAGDLDALARQLVHALDLARSIGRVGREHVGRDDRMTVH